MGHNPNFVNPMHINPFTIDPNLIGERGQETKTTGGSIINEVPQHTPSDISSNAPPNKLEISKMNKKQDADITEPKKASQRLKQMLSDVNQSPQLTNDTYKNTQNPSGCNGMNKYSTNKAFNNAGGLPPVLRANSLANQQNNEYFMDVPLEEDDEIKYVSDHRGFTLMQDKDTLKDLGNFTVKALNIVKEVDGSCINSFIEIKIVVENSEVFEDRISPKDLQKDVWISELTNCRAYLSPNTASPYKHIRTHISQAVTNGLIAKNITNRSKLPRHSQKEVKALSKEEQDLFINAAEGERLKTLFQFALGSGMRIGEILVLKWSNIDIENGIVFVKEQIQRIKTPNDDTKTKLVVCDVKSKSGNRSVPIPDSITTILMQHKLNQDIEKAKAGEAYLDNDIVFCNEIGGYYEQRNILRTFYRIRNRASLEGFNVHSLRHTYATRLLENGVNAKIAQALLGHSTIAQTLNTYTHVLPETKKEAVQAINDIFL